MMNQEPSGQRNAAGGGYGPPGGAPPGGYGGPPPGAPPGAPPGGFGGPPPGAPPGGFGGPPPGAPPGGFGGPPPGAPPGGFGGAPPGAPPGGFGAPPPAAPPPGAPGAYGAPPPGGAVPPGGPAGGLKKNSTLAVVSLVTGILALLPCCNLYIMWLVAIITGVMAKKEIKEKGLGGAGMATAGIVMGALSVLIMIAFTIFNIVTGGFEALF